MFLQTIFALLRNLVEKHSSYYEMLKLLLRQRFAMWFLSSYWPLLVSVLANTWGPEEYFIMYDNDWAWHGCVWWDIM